MNTPNNAQKLPQRILFASIAGLTAVVLCAGCTHSDTNSPAAPSSQNTSTQDADTSASVEPTSEPSSTGTTREPPAYPLNIDSFTGNNALKFAEYYLQVFSYSTQTGETALLSQITSDICTFCAGWIHDIENTYATGGRIENFSLEILSPPEITHHISPTYVLKVKLSMSEYWEIDSSGNESEKIAAKDLERDLIARFEEGAWTLENMGVYKS